MTKSELSERLESVESVGRLGQIGGDRRCLGGIAETKQTNARDQDDPRDGVEFGARWRVVGVLACEIAVIGGGEIVERRARAVGEER